MDMEWNQALTFSEMVKDLVFLTGEIIQIGAIKLNQTLEVVDSFNERIAPQYYTELHPKVAEITKLSNRDLQKGKGFHTVFNSFCDWCGDDFVFLVWGTEDLRILQKNMDLHNIDTSFMPPCFNLQNIFVDQVTHDTKQYALANALAIVGEVPFGNVKKCAVGKHPKSEKLGSTGQAACCARIHSRYFTGGSPSGLRV